MALLIGASAVLMAFCTSRIVANIGLLLGVALTGVLAIASTEAGTRKPAAKTIRVRRDKPRRWRGARCGAVYWVIAVTLLNGLIVAWCRARWGMVPGDRLSLNVLLSLDMSYPPSR